MDAEPTGTRDALIQAAGELFADHGLDGASTRAIAKKAKANLAAVNYHFGSKENLYLETLRGVLGEKCNSWGEVMEQAHVLTREGVSVHDALRQVIRDRLADQLEGVYPLWHTKLMLRTLLEPSPVLKALTSERFAPEYQRIVGIARGWNPSLTEEEAELWANSLYGQEIFYTLARAVLLEFEQWETYPGHYLDRVADHVARVMTAALWPRQLRLEAEA